MTDVVFWIGVKSSNPSLREKHGDFKYLKYSKKTWKWWCEKNNIKFVEYTKTSLEDTGTHRVNWQRWFDVFNQLEEQGIEYRKILLTDGSIMIKWDTPNFFNMVTEELTVFRSLENIKWINVGIEKYAYLFPKTSFDLKKYFSSGFVIFNKKHKEFFNDLKEFYFNNLDDIQNYQNNIKKGTDQPIFNFLAQSKNIEIENTLPDSYWLMHMNRFGWFNYNNILGEDRTPFFLKYGYIWVFSGFDRRQREILMKQTWDIIKNNYE